MKPKKQQPNKSYNEGHETSWGNVAPWYDAYLKKEDTYQSKVIWPNIDRFMSAAIDISSDQVKVCDIACGQGHFAYTCAQKGYQVYGVDISKELIAYAQRIAIPKQNTQIGRGGTYSAPVFYTAPSHDIPMIPNASIDIVTCILALQNIKLLDETCKEVARILKKNGRFIFVLNHPSFRVPQFSDWIFDQQKHMQSRTVAKYLQEATIKIDMNPGEQNGFKKVHTISFHRPLQVFVKLLAKHGYMIQRLEEWGSHKRISEGPQKDALNQARKEIPMFMCIEAIKAV